MTYRPDAAVRYDLDVARAFGPFDLLRPLGRGGFGEVFVAVRRGGPKDQTPIVLKRMRPEVAGDDEYRRRLRFEAQVASRLDHPNLVKLIEFGMVGQCPFLTMEHVRGYSLKRLLEQTLEHESPPSLAAGLSILDGILAGLTAMHDVVDEEGVARPILHRDVTPSNVIIDHEGKAVLIDFGIAKDVYGPSITQFGRIVGTARYMAPEHRSGNFVDPRADVFSASVIGWEVLTGSRPWSELTASKEILRVVFDPPEVDSHVESRVPSDVLQVILRGLVCDYEDRWKDARAMLEALRATESYAKLDPSKGPASVHAWATEQRLVPDEDLDSMVIDNKPSKGPSLLQEYEDMRWNAAGELRSERRKRDKNPTIPPGAQILSIPPLPPRRDQALSTAEIEAPVLADRERRRTLAGLVFLFALGVVLGLVYTSVG